MSEWATAIHQRSEGVAVGPTIILFQGYAEPDIAASCTRKLGFSFATFAMLTVAAPAQTQQAAVVEWAQSAAIRLDTVEAGHGFADMEPLRNIFTAKIRIALLPRSRPSSIDSTGENH